MLNDVSQVLCEPVNQVTSHLTIAGSKGKGDGDVIWMMMSVCEDGGAGEVG